MGGAIDPVPDALAEREEMIPAPGMTRQRGPRPELHCAQCVHHCTPRLALASLFHPAVTLRPIPEALRDGGRLHRTATIAHLTSDMPLRRSPASLDGFVAAVRGAAQRLAGLCGGFACGAGADPGHGLHRLELYTASLQREISKYAFLPGTLDLEKRGAGPACADASAAQAEEVSAYLEQLNERAGTLSIYVINLDGRVVATSNWRRPDSFMGEDLQFRPYFRDALSSGTGRLFGIGTTRGEPGYYLASALLDGNRTVGVAVTKVSLDQLEQSWSTVEAPVIVTDENGVVILGRCPTGNSRPCARWTRTRAKAFDQTPQYNRRAPRPWASRC